MMKTRILTLLAFSLLVGAAYEVQGQEAPDSLVEVRLIDGSTLYGTVVDDGDPLRVRLVSGDVVSISAARVRSVTPAQGRLRDGEFWRNDPNLTRLFAAPTARTMPAGSGYVAAYELFFPFVAVAVTDRLLIAAGTPIIGEWLDDRVFYVAPKFQLFSEGRTAVAVGGFFFEESDHYSTFDAGALYGVVTHGSADNAVSLALGAGYADDDFFGHPVAMLGAEFRVARTIKLVTENYLVDDNALFTFGPRFFGERLSAELGIGGLWADSDFIVLPIVNFAYVW